MAAEALARYETEIGITAIQEQIRSANKSQGHNAKSNGNTFETYGYHYALNTIVPQIAIKHSVPLTQLCCLSNITLKLPGIANTSGEIDGLIVEIMPDTSDSHQKTKRHVVSRVLCLIEMKRQINDIGPALESRKRTLQWLSGRTPEVDVPLWINKHYPTGRFNEPASPDNHVHRDKRTGDFYEFKSGCFSYYCDLIAALREHEFIMFFVKYGDITNMTSEETSRTIDRVSRHMDYVEGAPPGANDASVEDIRLGCIRTISGSAFEIQENYTAYRAILTCGRAGVHIISSVSTEEDLVSHSAS